MATEEFGTAVFKDGKMVPLDAEGDSFEFPEPDEVQTKAVPEAEVDIEIVDDRFNRLCFFVCIHECQKSCDARDDDNGKERQRNEHLDERKTRILPQ